MKIIKLNEVFEGKLLQAGRLRPDVVVVQSELENKKTENPIRHFEVLWLLKKKIRVLFVGERLKDLAEETQAFGSEFILEESSLENQLAQIGAIPECNFNRTIFCKRLELKVCTEAKYANHCFATEPDQNSFLELVAKAVVLYFVQRKFEISEIKVQQFLSRICETQSSSKNGVRSDLLISELDGLVKLKLFSINVGSTRLDGYLLKVFMEITKDHSAQDILAKLEKVKRFPIGFESPQQEFKEIGFSVYECLLAVYRHQSVSVWSDNASTLDLDPQVRP